MTRFLLIRHATNDTVGKTIAGRMPGVHLNEEGRQQAHDLSERLKGTFIDAVYSSPLERCRETAEPIVQNLNIDLGIIDEFAEIDYGRWTNCSLEQLKDDLQFRYWNSFRSGTRTPGGEMMIEVQARIVAGLQRLNQKHLRQTVAVISHGDPIKAALAFYMGMPLDFLSRIEVDPASVSVLDLYDETARVTLLNAKSLERL